MQIVPDGEDVERGVKDAVVVDAWARSLPHHRPCQGLSAKDVLEPIGVV